MNIHGSKKGGGKQRQPIIAPDSAQSKTFIKILYGLGEGEIAGLADGYKSVYLDDTPLQNDDDEFNFPNVKVDFRTGTNDQEYIDGFADVASETNVGVELKHGTPWVKSFNNLDLDALRVRIKWGALRQQNRENGDVLGVKIDYAIDVQTDGGGWVQALTTAINAKTSNAYERSHRIDLPKAQTGWAVRVRRITPNSTSELVSDTMYISAITEVIDLKLRYPNTALLGLRYDAEQFSNVAKMAARCRGLIIKVPTNYNPITRTYDGLWDGQFKMAYSNNPAWVYYDLCTATRYGLGGRLTEYMIDKWSLYRLAQYCDQLVDDGMGGQEPRFTVNVYIQSAEGAFELLSKLAGVFRAISYWDGTSIVLDADIPQDSIYSFSRANVIDGIFEYTGTRARDRHTVAKVAWDNPANHFKTEYEYVRDEKAIAKFGVRVADIQAWGCTSKGQAQRAGLWALKSEQLETRMVTFKVGLDGYIPAPAKVIEISDELFAGRATGGRVLAINDKKTIITLDRTITAKAGDTLVINGNDGTSQRQQISVVNGDNVTVTKPFGDISEQNVWVLDSQDLATMKFRVLSVTADDNHQFTITAVQYSPAKYDAIDHGAYTPERPISVINPSVQAPTKSVNLSSYHTVNQGVTVTTLVIGWEQVTGAVKYTVQWRKDNGNWQTLPPTGTNSIEITGVYAGQYEARVTAISAFGQASLATHSNLTQIQGKQGKPPRPINLTALGVLFGMNLGWGFVRGSDDTNYTEIQVSPDGRSNIATLGTFAYPTNKHEITGLQGNLRQFYRARIVDKLGNTSDWTDWVSGTTSADAEKVLDILSGQISQNHLDQSLRTPIGKIGTLESKISGINSKIPTIESNINSFNSKIPSINKIPTIESNINSVNSKIPAIESKISGINSKIPTIESNINSFNSKIPSINKIPTIESNINSFNSKIPSINKIPTIESNINSVNSRADTINSTLNNANNRLNEVVQSITNIDTRTQWQTLGATSLNSLTEQGKYYLESSFNTNTPLSGWQYATVDKARNGDRITQTVWNDSTKTYTRTKTGDTWSAWVESVDKSQLDNTANQLTQSIEQTSTQIRNELGTKANIDSVTGAIRDINALQADKNAKTQEIANLTQTVNGHTSSIRDLGVTTGELSQKYSQLKTTSDTANSEITAIKQTQSGQATSVERLRSEMADKASSADLQSVQQSLASKEQALTEQITTAKSELGGRITQISDETRTLSDANRTIGERINRLDSEIYSPNLLRDGDTPKTSSNWNIDFPITETLQAGRRVYISLSGASGLTSVAVYNSSPAGAAKVGDLTNDGGVWRGEFDWVSYGNNNVLQFYREPRSSAQTVTASLTTTNGSKIANLERTLTTTNQSLSERINTVESSMSGNTSSINTLSQSLTTKEQALSRRINEVNSSVSGNTSSINTLSQSLTTANRALTEQITTAKSELGGRITQISDETRTLSDANRTIGERIDRLDSELAGADSISDNLLVNSNRTLVTGAYLIATYRISETLKNGDKVRLTVNAPQLGINRTGFMAYNSNSAGGSKLADISESQGNIYTAEFEWNVGTGGNNEVWLYHDASNTRSISTITSVSLQKITTGSGLASIKSSVANLERTLTTNNQSLSERINTLQTTVNGQTASIQQHAQSLNGLSAQWTLKVQTNGIVSGIGLASNNGVSDFAIRADKLYVASPQGDKKPMFTVTTRPTTLNGTTVPTGMYLNGDLIASGTISGDKIQANTQITAPNIRGGSINIGNNFSVDSQGNLNANSGVFRGQVFADKITGQIDVESLKSSAVALGYDTYISDNYHASEPHQFDKTFKASYPSHGSITQSLGFNNENIGSIMYEMRVFCKRAITVKQKLHTVDDKLYCYVNGSSAFGYHSVHNGYDDEDEIPLPFGRGRINTEISLSLRQGLNTIQFVLNNSGGGICQVILIGDFIDNNIIKFA
ncbi:hypothetical protein [Moraxella phage Mcat17]|uniref:TipJ family phage tail tip protein n=1 Tax=Moraxella catarrhalis TaxID=480 RepID=UPI0007220B34|nr:phage tail protein [Moraxella catarrhalis]AKI27695.1 hypothetical protein [Moraxella phage Mcat17]MPW64202.1 DUF1983 domain-containing protein [Moraxella catarrhalis]